MGQKVNPNAIRLGIIREADSCWFAEKNFAKNLFRDMQARKFLVKELDAAAGISKIKIERPAKNARVTIIAARPAVIIGRKGEDAEKLMKKLSAILEAPVHLNVEEVRKPDLDAKIVADGIAKQIENRVMYRRAMKRAVTTTMKAGALGIKICTAGRLGGAEIARSEWYREGRVPLHTFRADIDFAIAEAKTTYGIIGVKVWIYKGDILDRKTSASDKSEKATTAEGAAQQ